MIATRFRAPIRAGPLASCVEPVDTGIDTCGKLCELDVAVGKSLRPQRGRDFAYHYNAACVYAFASHGCRPDSGNGQAEVARILATCSVAQLREAFAYSASGYVSSRRAWILSTDPDLAQLRHRQVFGTFEHEVFPDREPRPRPACVVELQMSAYAKKP